jgi:ornithine cyclodeaminase
VDVLLLREGEIRGLISSSQAVQPCRLAFAKLAKGEAILPDVMFFDIKEHEGEVHAKGAYLSGTPYFSIKVASGFYQNPSKSLPVGSGAVWAFDATTGLLRAILLDNGYLTELRTGAAGALSSDLLARPSVHQVAIIGCGSQARYQLEALMSVRRPEHVLVFCRTAGNAVAYAKEMSTRLNIAVEAAGSVREAVETADIVVTTTPSKAPIVLSDWIRPGTHIAAIGSDVPEKQELDVALFPRAKVVADRLSQCLTQGEIHHAVEAGTLRPDQVFAELGEIAARLKPGRENDEEITICDMTGVGVLDAAMADFVVTAAIESGKGERISA